VWVADITYIRLKTEFVYLAVILDAFSRKVVGWELDQTLAPRLPLTALVAQSRSGSHGPACIIPTAACSTHRATTSVCFVDTR